MTNVRTDGLAAAPFHLDATATEWVRTRFAALSPDDKVRQLFNLLCRGSDPAEIARMQAFRPGGITRDPGPDLVAERDIIEGFNAAAPVPLLVSADLEGSRMSQQGGTEMPNPLGLAALDDIAVTREVARIMAVEARAAGINWTFTPVMDVNAMFRSAIVATRAFGSDVSTIERHAIATLEEFQKQGVAATVKHWPGEGFDDRDQHLLTTINPLSMDEWTKSFGRLYSAAIAAGVLSVMTGHIALPAFAAQRGASGRELYRPASISQYLNIDLLRNELGFNGLIVSDATPMAGLGAWGKRSTTLPEIIANGCDVILFSTDIDADYGYVKAALDDGRLSMDRLDDAVIRQLGLKAAIGLHHPQPSPVPAIGRTEDKAFAEAASKRIPTLVKDIQNLLPLDPAVHRRVLVVSPGIINPWMPQPMPFILPDLLAGSGFEITAHAPGMAISPDAFDLVVLLFGEETLMTRGRIGLDWLRLMGNPTAAMNRPWTDIPTLLISFGYPYYLYDAPQVPAVINAYATTDSMQRAVAGLLLGNGKWNRNSPVDPFAGAPDARY